MKVRMYKIYTEIATKKQGSSGSRGQRKSNKEFEVQPLEGSEQVQQKLRSKQRVTIASKALIRIDKHEINSTAVHKEGSSKFSVYIQKHCKIYTNACAYNKGECILCNQIT